MSAAAAGQIMKKMQLEKDCLARGGGGSGRGGRGGRGGGELREAFHTVRRSIVQSLLLMFVKSGSRRVKIC